MTPQRKKPSIRAYPLILGLLGRALIGALYVNIQAREMTAQEVFGIDMDSDDV